MSNLKVKDRVKIVFNKDCNLIGKTGTIVKVVKTLEGVYLYKVRCNGKVIKDYATDDCLERV